MFIGLNYGERKNMKINYKILQDVSTLALIAVICLSGDAIARRGVGRARASRGVRIHRGGRGRRGHYAVRRGRGRYAVRRGYYGGARRRGRRVARRHGWSFGSAFWLGYPYEHRRYYTHYSDSCRVYNDTSDEVTLYTRETPQLTLPSGQSLYLPCDYRATIISPLGRVRTKVFNGMKIVDDGVDVFVE